MNPLQALQRKHEVIERDMDALKDKVQTLSKESKNLCCFHPNSADEIKGKEQDIVKNWEVLLEKAQERKIRLDDSYKLQRFLTDFRDLILWINDKKGTIMADELAKDVNGAEALLERHAEHKSDIDAHQDSFNAVNASGQALIDEKHYAALDVTEKLNILGEERSLLSHLWEKRRVMYEQCMDLQLFYRDTEQVEAAMSNQDAFLKNKDLGDCVDAVEVLIKKHSNFEKSLQAQEDKVKTLDEFASKLVEAKHYASEDVEETRANLLHRRSQLQDTAAKRRVELEDSLDFEQYDRDCLELLGWLNDRLKVASDKSYLEPANINNKVKNHQSFERETLANKTIVDKVINRGQELVDACHNRLMDIQKYMDEIKRNWDELVKISMDKGGRLEEASQEQQYNRTIEDVEMWLTETETQLSSEDFGKDLTTVQNLRKRQALIEADVASHQGWVHLSSLSGFKLHLRQFLQFGRFAYDSCANLPKIALNLSTNPYNLNNEPSAGQDRRDKDQCGQVRGVATLQCGEDPRQGVERDREVSRPDGAHGRPEAKVGRVPRGAKALQGRGRRGGLGPGEGARRHVQ